MILIIIKFGEVLFCFSPRIIKAAPRFFNPLLSVWISDEILFLVFDILHPHLFSTVNAHPSFPESAGIIRAYAS